MTLRTLLTVLLFGFHVSLFAGEEQPTVARIGSVLIEVPGGFDGPHRSHPNELSVLDVYVSRNNQLPTLVQLTRVSLPDTRNDLGEDDRYGASSKFLSGFLETFSGNVAEWNRSLAQAVRLNGHLAARATWTGKFHGIPTSGAMYMVIVDKDVYCLHAFGRSDIANPTLQAAIRSIDVLRTEKKHYSLENASVR